MPLFFYLLTNDHFEGDFLNKVYILSTFRNISLPFHEVDLIKVRQRTILLNNEQLFDVNQNLLARELKNIFSPSVFFPFSTSNNQGISYFHKSNCTCLYYFYHMCFIQRSLIGQFLKVSKFDWFL